MKQTPTISLPLAHHDSALYSEQMRHLDLLILLLMAAAGEGLAQPPIDSVALDKLFAEATVQHSSSLLVFQNGQPVREKFFSAKDHRIHLYSVTKTFTALSIGLAYDHGLIRSMDEPLSTWFPELANDPSKSRLKLRHVLQHTSGIFTTQGSRDIYPQKDFAKFALESAIVSASGEEFKYNNRAINIASAVVRKVTGQPMDALIAKNLFEPLAIKDYKFRHDRAGNTWAMDGLELKASDLVKIGCLLADGGKWNGRQIVSDRWMKMATQASLVSLDRNGAYGLGMFVIEMDAPLMIHVATVDALQKAGLDSVIAAKLRLVADRKFKGGKELSAALKAAMSTAELEAISAVAFREMTPIYDNLTGRKLLAHSGEIGEVVIGLQGSGIGVARTIDEKPGRAGDYTFGKIYRLVLDLMPAAP